MAVRPVSRLIAAAGGSQAEPEQSGPTVSGSTGSGDGLTGRFKRFGDAGMRIVEITIITWVAGPLI